MAKDPAVLFYTSDFLLGTAFFTDEQTGQYIKLLCHQHQSGHIPKDFMLQILKSNDNPTWGKFITDENGLYFNKRMEEEIQKRKNYSESRKKNISKRYEHTQETTREPTYVDTSVLHMVNENEDVNIDKNIDKEGFENFWNLYDKKRGDKTKLLAKWNKLKESEKLAIMQYIPRYKNAQPDKQFRKDPSTFLNNRAWEDEIITRQTQNGKIKITNNQEDYGVIRM